MLVFAEKIGNTVQLTFASILTTAISNTQIVSAGGSLPSVFCPNTNQVILPVIVTNNSVQVNGYVYVYTNGSIAFTPFSGGFTPSGFAGWEKQSISYSTAAL